MNRNLRIISLIPSATEIVYLLGLEKYLVGRSDDSNYPSKVNKVPAISFKTIGQNLTSLEIDNEVKNSLHQGRSLFHLDRKLLNELNPNLILTQELCRVCAIPLFEVKKAARILDSNTKIISLEPESIEDILDNILMIGEATQTLEKAHEIVQSLKKRMKKISLLSQTNPTYPTVIILEWMDPIMTPGHWVPEMVEKAGGKILLSRPLGKSEYVDWEEIVKADPDFLIFAPCGFTVKKTQEEFKAFKKKYDLTKLKAFKEKRAHILDGDAYFTRSGPRVIKGIEILSNIFH